MRTLSTRLALSYNLPSSTQGWHVTFNLSFTRTDGEPVLIEVRCGEVLFMLGANGTGKSSLVQLFYNQSRPKSRRILAHRQTWFNSNTLDLTPTGKKNTEQNIANNDTSLQARYSDHFASQRASMTVFDLIDAQNVRARSIAAAVDADDIEAARQKSAEEAPLAAINSLLLQSNIPIEIDVVENEQIVARKDGGAPFSIAELSDGERNALLIAGDVLTAKPGTLLIIDEPERHLHRSIISPLLTLLFAKRQDCAFIIATHDIDLPLDNEGARVLLVRSASYVGSSVQSWRADLLDAGVPLDETIKRDVIGSRRHIMFVEGKEESLDKPLYSLLFPMVSIVAKETCKEVEQAVTGLRAAHRLTWINAWGIVDGDNQSAKRIEDLKQKSIFVVPFYSVESLYYHPWVIRRVAERMSRIVTSDPDLNTNTAIDRGLAKVQDSMVRMVQKSATKAARELVLSQLPTLPSVSAGASVSIQINTAELVESRKVKLLEYLERREWTAVLRECPVRESGALEPMSKAIGFPGRKEYEAAVRTMLSDDTEALSFVRNLLQGAYEAVSAASPDER